jgi:hypothetical protein
MINIKQHHRQKHQHCIKNIQENFMVQQIPILTHNILNDSEDGSDHDHEAGAVEDIEVALPRDGELLGTQGRHGAEAIVEYSGDKDKETEKENLDPETAGDDVLAEFDTVVAGGFGEHPSSCKCVSSMFDGRRKGFSREKSLPPD